MQNKQVLETWRKGTFNNRLVTNGKRLWVEYYLDGKWWRDKPMERKNLPSYIKSDTAVEYANRYLKVFS